MIEGVIAETCENIMIMYGGTVVERGPSAMLGAGLSHPYSQGLIAAVPQPGRARSRRLSTISGVVPELHDLPNGCPFTDRCELSDHFCSNTIPGNHRRADGAGHFAACHKLPESWEAVP